jgi:excisionase family DNA binding protein
MQTDQAAEPQEGLCTTAQAARFLAISRAGLYKSFISTGKLTSIKLGKCRRIRWADLRRLIAEAAASPETTRTTDTAIASPR